jgi:hypothetical protein
MPPKRASDAAKDRAAAARREELTCAVCFELLDGPVVLSCGHAFCAACVFRSCASHVRCPTCRGAISGVDDRDGVLELRAAQPLARLVEIERGGDVSADERELGAPELAKLLLRALPFEACSSARVRALVALLGEAVEAAAAARPKGKRARIAKGKQQSPSAEALEVSDDDGRSLLWWALKRAPRRGLAGRLLDMGVPAASRDSEGVTTLMVAAAGLRDVDLFRRILKAYGNFHDEDFPAFATDSAGLTAADHWLGGGPKSDGVLLALVKHSPYVVGESVADNDELYRHIGGAQLGAWLDEVDRE